MTYTDNLGFWDSIGEVTLTLDWQLFPSELFGELLRFTYILDWDEWTRELDLRAYILGRFYYPTGDTVNVSPSFRLQPKSQPELRTATLSDKLKESGTVIRSLGVKAVRTNRRFYYSNAPIINMKLKAEYLL
jgi:hypothetical protein